jgi:hypothetical protein
MEWVMGCVELVVVLLLSLVAENKQQWIDGRVRLLFSSRVEVDFNEG